MTAANTIGFVGLSHLGIIYSTASAARGFSVCAFDNREDLTKNLALGRFPVSEPGLEDLFREHGGLIQHTNDPDRVADCRLVFFTLDVPTDEANNSDLTDLEGLISKIASRMQSGSTIVIMSQVPPGFCRKLAGRSRADLRLFYHVETLVFGDAVERAVRPERHIIGCGSVGEDLPEIYQTYLHKFGCPILPMRYESAELCKIAINCFLVSSVATANTLAEICEKIGADWSEIRPALHLDKRIGQHAYLKPGLGIAGGNLERDLVTVQKLAGENGSDAEVVTAWQRNSVYRRDWVLRQLFRLGLLKRPDETLLGLWGLTYKPDTHSIKNSPSIALLRSLPGYRWLAYDPAARIQSSDLPGVQICKSPMESARDVEGLVVMTPWKEFAGVSLDALRETMRGRYILDPYGILDHEQCRKLGFTYYRLGN